MLLVRNRMRVDLARQDVGLERLQGAGRVWRRAKGEEMGGIDNAVRGGCRHAVLVRGVVLIAAAVTLSKLRRWSVRCGDVFFCAWL